jgi:hypothetical protein
MIFAADLNAKLFARAVIVRWYALTSRIDCAADSGTLIGNIGVAIQARLIS